MWFGQKNKCLEAGSFFFFFFWGRRRIFTQKNSHTFCASTCSCSPISLPNKPPSLWSSWTLTLNLSPWLPITGIEGIEGTFIPAISSFKCSDFSSGGGTVLSRCLNILQAVALDCGWTVEDLTIYLEISSFALADWNSNRVPFNAPFLGGPDGCKEEVAKPDGAVPLQAVGTFFWWIWWTGPTDVNRSSKVLFTTFMETRRQHHGLLNAIHDGKCNKYSKSLMNCRMQKSIPSTPKKNFLLATLNSKTSGKEQLYKS